MLKRLKRLKRHDCGVKSAGGHDHESGCNHNRGASHNRGTDDNSGADDNRWSRGRGGSRNAGEVEPLLNLSGEKLTGHPATIKSQFGDVGRVGAVGRIAVVFFNAGAIDTPAATQAAPPAA